MRFFLSSGGKYPSAPGEKGHLERYTFGVIDRDLINHFAQQQDSLAYGYI
jgi:hypothetical protein